MIQSMPAHSTHSVRQSSLAQPEWFAAQSSIGDFSAAIPATSVDRLTCNCRVAQLAGVVVSLDGDIPDWDMKHLSKGVALLVKRVSSASSTTPPDTLTRPQGRQVCHHPLDVCPAILFAELQVRSCTGSWKRLQCGKVSAESQVRV